jgi:hypothetical protein
MYFVPNRNDIFGSPGLDTSIFLTERGVRWETVFVQEFGIRVRFRPIDEQIHRGAMMPSRNCHLEANQSDLNIWHAAS